MQLRSKSAVFAIAAVLGAGLAVPGALALTGSSSDTQTKPASVQSVEQTHEADAAEQHEATQPEQTAAEDQAKKDATTSDTPTTANPKAFGATGDEHRSDTAAQHSQADCHRATGPGQPADGSKCTPPAATAPTNDSTQAKRDDDATEAGHDDEATETEHDDESGEVQSNNSGPGSTNSGHGSSHSGSDD